MKQWINPVAASRRDQCNILNLLEPGLSIFLVILGAALHSSSKFAFFLVRVSFCDLWLKNPHWHSPVLLRTLHLLLVSSYILFLAPSLLLSLPLPVLFPSLPFSLLPSLPPIAVPGMSCPPGSSTILQDSDQMLFPSLNILGRLHVGSSIAHRPWAQYLLCYAATVVRVSAFLLLDVPLGVRMGPEHSVRPWVPAQSLARVSKWRVQWPCAATEVWELSGALTESRCSELSWNQPLLGLYSCSKCHGPKLEFILLDTQRKNSAKSRDL